MMRGWVAMVVLVAAWIGLLGMYGLLRPISNGCVMTYMYPTYIPISNGGESASSPKYGLHLYHEGWKKIDFAEHLKHLSGVPVLFIPGNGGSYKQVRSLAAESDRAYQSGPQEKTFYQEAFLTSEEGGTIKDIAGFQLPSQYSSRLDWFAVDLEGEHSAMDGRILEEHTEYVVYAIHRILDHYKESRDSREREGAASSSSLPKSVILVGHSMGGFVARAAVIHPRLRNEAVETVVTLSTPHQSPPVALQPSLGEYFERVNEEWKKGFKVQTSPGGHYQSDPPLSHVVVVSISGGYNDYQVRTKLETLNDIVPPTHGFMISSTGMRNVWLSMEHQAILWCNQLVVQVSHTLLSLIDSRTGQPISGTGKRLAVFAKMLRSGIPQSFQWIEQIYMPHQSIDVPTKDVVDVSEVSKMNGDRSGVFGRIVSKNLADRPNQHFIVTSDSYCRTGCFLALGTAPSVISIAFNRDKSVHMHVLSHLLTVMGMLFLTWLGFQMETSFACPSNVHWNDDGLERDLYIQTTTMTVLAMDGKRRWLDIQKLGSNGKSHFMFVTNLSPCSGIRLHLWPEKGNPTTEFSATKRVVEVTSRLVQIPSGPAPKQIEPGSQTEQPPPSAVLWLNPDSLLGFRFLTVSVAPRLTLSGRPPPAASMAVGQFFNPNDGKRDISARSMLLSTYSKMDTVLGEDHPLALNLSFSVSLGLLPVSLSLTTTGCGIKRTTAEEFDNEENSRLCKLRCFPPVAFAWDPTSGLHIFPNLYTQNVVVDSSPALLSSVQGSEKTTVLLLVDPHCSYKMGMAVSDASAAGRFLVLYGSQVVGLSVAVIFFALMRQAHEWDLDRPTPSVSVAIESNLRMASPFLLLGLAPIGISLFLAILNSQPLPSFGDFITISIICYLFANGCILFLALASQLAFYVAAVTHVFIKNRWQSLEANVCFGFLHWFINLSSSFFSLKVVGVLRVHPLLVTALAAITLGCFVHPAFGLSVLLLSHVVCCHSSLCSHARQKELLDCKDDEKENLREFVASHDGGLNRCCSLEENITNSPNSVKTFGETQLEVFHHRHGLFILHLLAALMFIPSLVAWLQRIGLGHSFPWFLDSALCSGVIFHGTLNSKPEFSSLFTFPGIFGKRLRLDLLYLMAGYYCYLSGLNLEPYRVFNAMAMLGFLSLALRIVQMKSRETAEPRFGRKKHSHRH